MDVKRTVWTVIKFYLLYVFFIPVCFVLLCSGLYVYFEVFNKEASDAVVAAKHQKYNEELRVIKERSDRQYAERQAKRQQKADDGY